MKTNSLKAIENVNTVANIKTMATMCTKDLKKRLAKEERLKEFNQQENE